MRWALKISEFRYVIEHVPGERNVWADMLTRWAVESPPMGVKSWKISRLLTAPINPSVVEEFDQPSKADIIAAQLSRIKKVILTMLTDFYNFQTEKFGYRQRPVI